MMAKNQVKLYVSDEEKKQLEYLAKINATNVSNYIRMRALGVEMTPPKEIYVVEEKEVEVVRTEIIQTPFTLTNDELDVIADFFSRYDENTHFIRPMSTEFNQELATFLKSIKGRHDNAIKMLPNP